MILVLTPSLLALEAKVDQYESCIQTLSTSKDWLRAWLSCTSFRQSCCFSTLANTSGCIWSYLVQRFWPNISSAGGRLVVLCRTYLYEKRNPAKQFEMVPFFNLLNPFLNTWTARSACPCEDGWYGAVFTWRTPFLVRKDPNTSLVNQDPSSITA